MNIVGVKPLIAAIVALGRTGPRRLRYEVRNKFTNRAVREAIAKDDEPLSRIYQDL
jgi:hypothetical protein